MQDPAAWLGPGPARDRASCPWRVLPHAEGLRVTRAQFERNLAAKVGSRAFLTEVVPMLVAGVEYDGEAAADLVRAALVSRLPGEPWRGEHGDE